MRKQVVQEAEALLLPARHLFRLRKDELGIAPEVRVRDGNLLETDGHVLQTFGSIPHEPEKVPATHGDLTAYLLVPGFIADQRFDFGQKRRHGVDFVVVVQGNPGTSHQKFCLLLEGPCRDERKPSVEDVPLAFIEGFVSVLCDEFHRTLCVLGR